MIGLLCRSKPIKRTVNDAIFAKGYENPQLLANMSGSTTQESKNLITTLMKVTSETKKNLQAKVFLNGLVNRKETPMGVAAFEAMLERAQKKAEQIED